jgi:hypothetical protein
VTMCKLYKGHPPDTMLFFGLGLTTQPTYVVVGTVTFSFR